MEPLKTSSPPRASENSPMPFAGAVIGYTRRDFSHMTFGVVCCYDGGMNLPFGQPQRWTSVSDFIGTIWPPPLAKDSESE